MSLGILWLGINKVIFSGHENIERMQLSGPSPPGIHDPFHGTLTHPEVKRPSRPSTPMNTYVSLIRTSRTPRIAEESVLLAVSAPWIKTFPLQRKQVIDLRIVHPYASHSS